MCCQNRPSEQAWHVYLLECADKTLYCGIARDPAMRLAQHNGTLKAKPLNWSGRSKPARVLKSYLTSKPENLDVPGYLPITISNSVYGYLN